MSYFVAALQKYHQQHELEVNKQNHDKLTETQKSGLALLRIQIDFLANGVLQQASITLHSTSSSLHICIPWKENSGIRTNAVDYTTTRFLYWEKLSG